MYRHICRFIDDHQIFVFIDNVERQADWNDIFRGLFFLECDFQQITGFERKIKRSASLSFRQTRTGMLLEPGADVPGIAVMTQKIIDALITVLYTVYKEEYSFHLYGFLLNIVFEIIQRVYHERRQFIGFIKKKIVNK